AKPARPPEGWKRRPRRTAGRGGAMAPRPRSTARSLRTLLVFAARARFARLLISGCGVEHVILAVLIVVPDPCHGERESVFVAALGSEIEEAIRSHQGIEAARIGRVGMEDRTRLIFVEDAEARRLLQAESPLAVVVIDLAGEFFFREVHTVVALEVGGECRDPVKTPAHALLKCLYARHQRAGNHRKGHVAVRQVYAGGIEVVRQERAGLASF